MNPDLMAFTQEIIQKKYQYSDIGTHWIALYFCIRFIDFIFKGKTLTEYTNLFFSYDFKKNGNVIMSSFKK